MIKPANSYQMLALLADDMDAAECDAVWVLVRYLREKEIQVGSAQSGASAVPANVEEAVTLAPADLLIS